VFLLCSWGASAAVGSVVGCRRRIFSVRTGRIGSFLEFCPEAGERVYGKRVLEDEFGERKCVHQVVKVLGQNLVMFLVCVRRVMYGRWEWSWKRFVRAAANNDGRRGIEREQLI